MCESGKRGFMCAFECDRVRCSSTNRTAGDHPQLVRIITSQKSGFHWKPRTTHEAHTRPHTHTRTHMQPQCQFRGLCVCVCVGLQLCGVFSRTVVAQSLLDSPRHIFCVLVDYTMQFSVETGRFPDLFIIPYISYICQQKHITHKRLGQSGDVLME